MKTEAESPCFIIAEAGVNHDGKIEQAKALVDAALEAGADAVKFQTFRAERLSRKDTPKAEYSRSNTDEVESHYQMLKRLELSLEEQQEVADYSAQKGITFLSSPFDVLDIDDLLSLGLKTIKVPSGEIQNYPYLRRLSQLDVDVILSTGMCHLQEIQDAVALLEKGGMALERVSILHCNTEYPTPMEDVNLRVMSTLSQAFPQCTIGYSDHTQGIDIPVAAVALGAKVIEKHFTLSRELPGPDHKASLEPHELEQMVKGIRDVEKALGSGEKKPSPSEKKNMSVARKSLVAAREIPAGKKIEEDDLAVKRPGNGMNPMKWPEIVGQVANRDYEKDQPIEG